MAYLTAWARDNNWIVVPVPSGSKIVREGQGVNMHSCGLYLQPSFAKDILEGILKANETNLAKFPVDMKLYGQINAAGYHDLEPPPVVREWDPKRKTWSDYWKTLFSEDQLKTIEQDFQQFEVRLSNQLKKPETLLDIAKFGMQNELYSTVCIAEILQHLYHTNDFNVLIASDDYNEWFDSSGFMSFRHFFKKAQRGHIPPHDLALVRMFMKFDGHLIRNGVKIAATTQKHYFNHVCTPEKINFPYGYAVEVGPLALNDFRNACKYYNAMEWYPHKFTEWDIESHYMMSEGNWYHFQQSMQNSVCLKL